MKFILTVAAGLVLASSAAMAASSTAKPFDPIAQGSTQASRHSSPYSYYNRTGYQRYVAKERAARAQRAVDAQQRAVNARAAAADQAGR